MWFKKIKELSNWDFHLDSSVFQVVKKYYTNLARISALT